MASVDFVARAQAAEYRADTHQYSEQYIVSGLGSTDREQMAEALKDPQIPVLGEAHPSDPTALCIRKRAEPDGVNTARVTVDFERPTSDSDDPLLDTTGVSRFFAATVQEVTTFDADGNLITVTWNGSLQNVFPDGVSVNPLTLTPVGRAQKEVPTFGFTLDKRETSIAAVTGLSQSHVGRLNNAEWPPVGQEGPSGVRFPLGTVLCTGIDLETVNANEKRATYTFQYKPDGWGYQLVAKLYERIPDNVSDTNGIATFRIYDQAAFTALPVKL